MINNLIHHFFSIKFGVADELIHCLPEPLKSKIVTVQRTVITAVHEVTEEYLKKDATEHKPEHDKSNLSSVPIE